MSEIEPGLYESLVTEALQARLDGSNSPDLIDVSGLDSGDAADRIALHVSREVERALRDIADEKRVEIGVQVARTLISRLVEVVGADLDELPIEAGKVLRSVGIRKPDGSLFHAVPPLTPLLDTTLLTNASGEPTLWSQLRSEIASADSIDVIMAFVRKSGIAPLLDALKAHCNQGRRLRILTTTYTDSTEAAALEQLREIDAEVRVSYDLTSTRLHAKAWMFRRNTGLSTAYVGSSNLTHSAQVTGLEWNVRLSNVRNATVLDKFAAVFDSYWESGEFLPYSTEEFAEERRRAGRRDLGPNVVLSPLELRPEPFQERLLELIEVSRQQGHHRNLLVSATGTGKTVMAAIDYARLRERLPRSRLLFVAHREEILDQSVATFRYALRDATFGEKWVGGSRPTDFEHVFASIQSLHASALAALPPDHFDVVIVDEFHHAAAKSYERMLNHVEPAQLLGLTATPERSDGLPILHWFDDRVAAELRLWDAIDQQHLSPFLYFGIHDGMDLTEIPWRRGIGYDIDALSEIYTSSSAWARLVIQEVVARVDAGAMRALGFCVSVQHAQFMAQHFAENGVAAVAIWSNTPDDERRQALKDLATGKVNIVFSVDLFNEGVDVPAIDTVLMLRPTESPTLFLQQLGRGLRKSQTGKSVCMVLDFVGMHRKEFRFDRRLRALLGGTRRDVEQAVEKSFPFLPAGCSMQLDVKAKEIVLRSIREAIPTRWKSKVDELRSLQRERPTVGLREFLFESGLELEDVYDGSKSWSDMQEQAGVPVAAGGPYEAQLRRSVGRLLHVDDVVRIAGYERLMSMSDRPEFAGLRTRDQRILQMLVASMLGQVIDKNASWLDATALLWQHPQVLCELSELFGVLRTRIDHVHASLERLPECPLQIHGRYTRLEILTAFGLAECPKVPSWQAGVWTARSIDADLLAMTLDKSGRGFSPTTRYRDYALSPTLIHWESQSAVRADSETGLRYQNHASMDHSIYLFTRLKNDDRAFWFLGPATYVSHTGEKPMAITWKLEHPLAGDMFQAFAAAVA